MACKIFSLKSRIYISIYQKRKTSLTKRVVFLVLLAAVAVMTADSGMAETYTPVLVFGGTSSAGNGQFNSPWGVSVDSAGNIYVVDRGNSRIQKFDSSGGYITQFGSQFGIAKSGDGQLRYPYGIAIDRAGNVYVADTGNGRIQKLSSSGVYISKFGSLGSGNGQFNTPYGIAIDSTGNIYVSDNSRTQKFSSSGTYLSQFGTYGTGNGQFSGSYGVAVDDAGNIYVADAHNSRIQKFNSLGVYQSQFGSWGKENKQFKYPYGIAIDSAGH